MRTVVGAGTFHLRGLDRIDHGDVTDPDTFTLQEWQRMNGRTVTPPEAAASRQIGEDAWAELCNVAATEVEVTRKQRHTRTTRHIFSDRASDGVEHVPAGTFADPTFVPRLSWSVLPEKVDYDREALCAGIASAQNLAFFCDASIFDDNAPAVLWSALFDGDAEICITPRIEAELQPWFDQRPGHPARTAVVDPTKLKVVTAADWTTSEQQSFVHYTNVIALRKRMLRWGELEFERREGRAPTSQDQRFVHGLVQRAVGERGFLFAKKGQMQRAAGSYSYADEELVYTAVAYALRTGRQTIILTKDEDLVDQFYRLISLLDTHYRSMLFAQSYRDVFSRFRSHAMPRTGAWVKAFVGESNVLVEGDDDLPWRVLPRRFNFVAVSCWLVGERYQRLTFGAEVEMQSLLEVKGRTRGKNTEVLGARNCHLLSAGMLAPHPACFAIAEDRTHDIAGQKIPRLELIEGVSIAERSRRLSETPFAVPKYPLTARGVASPG